MDKWEKDKINEIIIGLQKEQNRKFIAAYSSLPEKFWGYVFEYPQKIKVWQRAVDEDFLKELRSKFGYDKVYISNDSKLYYSSTIPYMGVDGCLAMLKHESQYFEIKLEFLEIKDNLFVKANITSDNGCSEGVSEIYKDRDGKYEDTEIAVSNAIRKALTYFGYGRFPFESTEYKENPTISKFRKYTEENKN